MDKRVFRWYLGKPAAKVRQKHDIRGDILA